MNTIGSKLIKLYAEAAKTRRVLDTLEDQIAQLKKQAVAQTEVVKRKASIIIKRKDIDLAIVVSNPNTDGERKAHWHDGKRKTELLCDSSRNSIYQWRVWLGSEPQ